MTEAARRDASLDLTGEDLRALLAGVTALAERELAAAASGPVFDRPPSAAEIDRVVDAGRPLPRDGENLEELLAACAAVLAAGRRTTPGFFGFVQSPPAPVAVAADLLASAADQNLTSWRSGPAAAAVEHQTLRWLGEFVSISARALGSSTVQVWPGPSPASSTSASAVEGLDDTVGPARCHRVPAGQRVGRETARSLRRRRSSGRRRDSTPGRRRRPPVPGRGPPARRRRR